VVFNRVRFTDQWVMYTMGYNVAYSFLFIHPNDFIKNSDTMLRSGRCDHFT